MVAEDEVDVLLQHLPLLFYPLLADLHDLGDGDVVVLGVQDDVVVQGVGVDVGLDEVQPVLLVLLVLRELYTELARLVEVLHVLLLVLVDLVLGQHEQLLEDGRLDLEDRVVVQEALQLEQRVERDLLLVERLKGDFLDVFGEVEDGRALVFGVDLHGGEELHLPDVLEAPLPLRPYHGDPLPELLHLADVEVAGCQPDLQLLDHHALEDLPHHLLPQLLVLLEAEALDVLLEGHREQEEAEDLLAVQLPHVEVYSRLYEEALYALFDALDFEVAREGSDLYLAGLGCGLCERL